VLRRLMAIPQIGVEPLMPTISGKTREFCVASASVLDMPGVRVSLRLCHVWRVDGRAVCGSVRHSSSCQEVTCRSCLRSKHERSNRWRLMTAVVGLALAVPVLVVATGLQEPDSPRLFGWTVALTRRGVPGRRERFYVRAALALDSFGGHR
jgi:hypothetical protein